MSLQAELLYLAASAVGDLELDFDEPRIQEGLDALRALELEGYIFAAPQLSGRFWVTRSKEWNAARKDVAEIY